MNRPVDETREAAHPPTATTVLDRVRPTVVVRRRVYQVAPAPGATPQRVDAHAPRVEPRDDDDNGPPSSVNVARALASLRVDELRRVEEIVSADDDPAVSSVPSTPSIPSIPSIRVGATIALADLAREVGVPKQELVTTLVTRGFFSVTVKTVLPRETARTAALMFGWRVEDDDEVVAAPEASPKKDRSSVKARIEAKPALKPAKKKPARRRG